MTGDSKPPVYSFAGPEDEAAITERVYIRTFAAGEQPLVTCWQRVEDRAVAETWFTIRGSGARFETLDEARRAAGEAAK